MMYANPMPMGHAYPGQVKMAAMSYGTITMELERMKMIPAVPAEAYLDILNKLLEPIAIMQGPLGLRTWLAEVQMFMTRLKQRSFGGMPLSPRERQVLQWYSARWRELRGGPCDMGRPEAQIVLIALGELALF